MTTANKITIFRVILIPVFLVLMYLRFPGHTYWAFGVFVLASLSDFADGYIARHYNQVSDFGKFMDPLADKLLVVAAMLLFVEQHRMPAWALLLVVAREFAVTGLRLIAVVAVTLTLASMFIIPCVARVFVGYDAELLALTSRAFRLYALSFLIMGFNVYASSFFTALGDGVTSALISFLRTLLFQVVSILTLPLIIGVDGIWLAVVAAEAMALVCTGGFVVRGRKRYGYL